MDVNHNRRPAQAQSSDDAAAPAPAVTKVAAEPGDWRSQLSQESRQKVVNRIVEVLKVHIPSSEGIHELRSMAMKFEEKIYVSATNQSDYLKKISMKMISMESKPRPMANSMQSNSATSAHNSQVPGVHTGMQSQVNSEGQPLSFPVGTNQSQSRQQLGSHNNTTSTGLQNSSTNLTQPSIAANVVNQGYGLQGVANVTVASTMCSNMVSNSQRQVQGRLQQQEQQQQSQTSSQMFYPQHVHKSQMMKPQSSMQSHIQQQQNLVPHNQIQPSQRFSVQQATSQALFQQHSQSLLRQQQQNNQQQQGSMLQQSMLQSKQQQQLIGHHQNQMIVQQRSFLDMQQQSRVIPLQSNYSNIHHQQLISQQNMHQQQLGNQGNTVGLQNQQIHGNQPCSSGLQSNQSPIQTSQHSKVLQQQMLSNSTQQQLMSQNQTQPGALQIQHQANSLQREVQQRIQASSPMLQQQNVIDQQKPLLQQQRATPEAPSTSLDSTAQTGNENGTDWQEETYQKIKSLRDMYYRDLNDTYTKLSGKLAQYDSHPQAPTSDHIKKIKYFVSMMENLLQVLSLNKSEIQLQHKERLSTHEKHMLYFVNSNRPRKPGSSIKQGQPHHLQMQPNHAQTHYNQVNPQMQSVNIQGSIAATMHHNNMHQSPFSAVSAVSASQQNMINMLQHATGVDLGQGSSLSSMQMVANSPLQQNSIGPQHMNISALSSRSGANTMQSSLSSTLHPNSHMLQHQHSKQHEHQMLHNQQIRQQNQQQFFHKQQLMQQQRQMKQSHAPLAAHHLQQLHQMADSNDLRLTQHMPVKTGILQQHQSVIGQRMTVQHKSSISSPQLQQALSPQLSHHTSPQIDKQSTLALLTKAGTPLQSTSSQLVVPSPSTPFVQSPMPGESEKASPGIPSPPNAGNIAYQKAHCSSPLGQSLSVATPGISVSPLLDEFSSLDGTHPNVSSISGTTSVDQPLQRLIKVASRMSPEVFSSTVSDISSFVSMVDRIAGSAPGNGSRAAVGEDLVAMTRCRMQARSIYLQDVPTGTKKMKRYSTLNAVSSCGSVYDGFAQRNGSETSDLESTATSCVKKRRVEVSHSLAQEIKEINRRLVDTIVEVCNEGLDPSIQAAAPVDYEGITIKCSFSAVAVGPSLKSHFASVQMSPIQPLRLRVPTNYPKSSPILLDMFPVKNSKELEDISVKVKSMLSTSLRTLSEPMSLKEIASTWDVCAREVISEYAQQRGGGSFSSKYGTWENCLSSA